MILNISEPVTNNSIDCCFIDSCSGVTEGTPKCRWWVEVGLNIMKRGQWQYSFMHGKRIVVTCDCSWSDVSWKLNKELSSKTPLILMNTTGKVLQLVWGNRFVSSKTKLETNSFSPCSNYKSQGRISNREEILGDWVVEEFQAAEQRKHSQAENTKTNTLLYPNQHRPLNVVLA